MVERRGCKMVRGDGKRGQKLNLKKIRYYTPNGHPLGAQIVFNSGWYFSILNDFVIIIMVIWRHLQTYGVPSILLWWRDELRRIAKLSLIEMVCVRICSIKHSKRYFVAGHTLKSFGCWMSTWGYRIFATWCHDFSHCPDPVCCLLVHVCVCVCAFDIGFNG